MAGVVDHLEQHLGEIEGGWSVDADGRPVPFQIVRCPASGLEGCVAFSTLGLSDHGALPRERTDAADHHRRIIGSSVERIGDVSLQPADVGIRWRERC